MTAKNKHTKDKNSMKELFSEGLGALRLEEWHPPPNLGKDRNPHGGSR